MVRVLKPSVISLRIALLFLLLSMQGFALAHELDQGVVHDGSVCIACSVGSHHDATVQSHQEAVDGKPASQQSAITVLTQLAQAPAFHPEARAPPSSL